MSRNITIIIAAHKSYSFPEDSGYAPLHVGSSLAQNDLGIAKDDIGDGMSELNPYYCELTGLNWLWKTNKAKACGLVHYRRYFKSPKQGLPFGKYQIASSEELSSLMQKYDVVLPKPRNYFVESVRVHYANAHFGNDLDIAEQIIRDDYPEYLPVLNRVLSRTSLSLYNMFVMSHENMCRYSEWVFDILKKSEKGIDYKSYNAFQARVFGRIAEILLNVWVEHNFDQSKICYLPVVNIEGENLVKKAYYLLRRKFLNEKMG